MALEGFNWKSLFINEEDSKSKAPETQPKQEFPSAPQQQQQQPTTSFPNEVPKQTVQQTQSYGSPNNPFLDEIFQVYEKGFESLNETGFDFYEMYKSVMSVGVNNPQSFQMAFTMGKTINPNLSKQFLLEKAAFYKTEIEKVFVKYDTTGNNKRNELNNSINQDKHNLSKSIADIESQIANLQNELNAKKAELNKIDSNSSQQFVEIDLKIQANNLAKQKLFDSIIAVELGINQYL